MDAKHTPGPWIVADELIEHEASGMPVCSVMSSSDFPCISEDETQTEEEKRAAFDEEGRANAHLIAAAPDLLASLVKMVEAYRDGPDDSDQPTMVTAALAAIAKATPIGAPSPTSVTGGDSPPCPVSDGHP